MSDYIVEKVYLEDMKEYDSKFGRMRSIPVKFREVDRPVSISQKLTSPYPKEGETLHGTIEKAANPSWNDRFRKDFNREDRPFGSKPKGRDDNFTMYLSYAKDIAVKLLESESYSEDYLLEVCQSVSKGGELLYAEHNKSANKEKMVDSHPLMTDLEDRHETETVKDQIHELFPDEEGFD